MHCNALSHIVVFLFSVPQGRFRKISLRILRVSSKELFIYNFFLLIMLHYDFRRWLCNFVSGNATRVQYKHSFNDHWWQIECRCMLRVWSCVGPRQWGRASSVTCREALRSRMPNLTWTARLRWVNPLRPSEKASRWNEANTCCLAQHSHRTWYTSRSNGGWPASSFLLRFPVHLGWTSWGGSQKMFICTTPNLHIVKITRCHGSCDFWHAESLTQSHECKGWRRDPHFTIRRLDTEV